MRLIFKMGVRRLKGRKLSIALACFILAWAMAMSVAGLASSQTLEESSSAYLDQLGMPDLFVSLSEGLTAEEVEEALSSLPAQTYQTRLRVSGHTALNGSQASIVLIGTHGAEHPINRLSLIEGSLFSQAGEGVAVKGGKLNPGPQDIFVNGTMIRLDITGLVRSAEYLTNELNTGSIVPGSGGLNVIYLPLEDLQGVTGPIINDISFRFEEELSLEQVEAALSALPVSSIVPRGSHQTSVLVQMGADKFEVMLPAISVVFTSIGLLAIFITTYRMVIGDSRSIGVLMSIGLERRRIACSYLVMGLVIIAAGGAAGAALGYAFTAAMSQLALDMMGRIPVVASLDPLPYLLAVGLTALAVAIAVLAPVLLVVRRSVRDVLRYVPRSRIWAWRRTSGSLAVALGVRNLFREPKRATVVMVAVGLSIGTAGSWVLMSDSMQSYFDEQMGGFNWDIRVDLNQPMDRQELVDRLSFGPAAQVIPYLMLTGSLASSKSSSTAVIAASPSIGDIKDFDLREGALGFEGLVVSKKLADELQVAPGDMVNLNLGGTSYPLMVTGEVNDLQTNAAYTADPDVIDALGAGLCQGAYVILEDRSAVALYASSVLVEPMVGSIEIKEDAVSSFNALFEGSISLLYAFFALNLMIALAVAFMAAIISYSERDLEFTALISLGLPRGFAWRSMAVEVGVQATASILVALPTAFLMARVFSGLMEDAVFYIPIYLTAASLATVAMVGWLFVWPSILWPIRWFRRLDIVRTLRERAGG